MRPEPTHLPRPEPAGTPPLVSVIIPVYENSEDLRWCLEALRKSTRAPSEIIVVDDASRREAQAIADLCMTFEAQLVRQTQNRGPAAARNAGARAAKGDVLFFVDADVVVYPDTLQAVADVLQAEPDLQAVFGSYCDQPSAPGTVSQFRNLLHHYVHHQSAGPASTFWTGCGAVRLTAFQSVGGFDERYAQPSIEDVELGGRLHTAGHRIELRPHIQVTHRKPWTLTGMMRTDLWNRAVPWTEAALRARGLPRGLNFGWQNRASVGLAGLAAIAMIARLGWLAAAAVLLLWALNLSLYRFVYRKRGARALPGSMLAHLAHYFTAGAGMLVGAGRYVIARDRWSPYVFVTALVVILIVQVVSGAFTADFTGYPDEPAHFVTSVFFGEYWTWPFQDPLTFASQYYLQYPKLAVGHWPPLGYALQGIWLHAFGGTRVAALLFLSVCGAAAAWMIYDLLWRDTGRWLAAGAALAWLGLSGVQRGYQQTMMDMLAVALCLLAALAYREYVQRLSAAPGLLFGLFAASALLVKQQSFVLAFIPPAYLLLSRRWTLLRRRDFWLPILPVLIVAAPWYVLSTAVFYKNLVDWSGFAGHGAAAAGFDGSVWWRGVSLPVALLSVVGLLHAAVQRNLNAVIWAALLLSTVAGSFVLQVMNEPRHVLAGLAAQVALAAVALSLLPARVYIAGAALLIAICWRVESTPHAGYTAAAATLQSGTPGHILVAATYDGALIAAAVERRPKLDGARYWLRAKKVLANVRWSGGVSELYVHSTAEVHSLLRNYGVNQVYLEEEIPDRLPPYTELLQRALREDQSSWSHSVLPVAGVTAHLYQRLQPVKSEGVSFYLPRLGRSIGDAPR